jgi:hypothetical protein
VNKTEFVASFVAAVDLDTEMPLGGGIPVRTPGRQS